MRYLLDLDGDERVVLRALKLICKQLLRRFGIRVKGIKPASDD